MRTVAVYNMKGGVGKTTAAVNLSYLAAASGQRTLLWDLDPQAAASFAFRVRPNVSGFDKKSLANGKALAAAIKETDHRNLDLLPADFAYRKFERFLGSHGKPERLIGALLETVGRDFDLVFLDCPAGFSLLTEAIFSVADAILVPTIPTVLSLRMVGRLIKWAERSDADVTLAAFFNMVDRRKALHRRACECSSQVGEVFLAAHVPYASIVEQTAVRRLPLSEFAPRDEATRAFEALWIEFQNRLDQIRRRPAAQLDRWAQKLRAVGSLIDRLEPRELESLPAASERNRERGPNGWSRPGRDLIRDGLPGVETDVSFVHRFDTERRDLEQRGHHLELCERHGSFFVVASLIDEDRSKDGLMRSQVQIDNFWAVQILAGEMSPLAPLEQRLGLPGPPALVAVRLAANGRTLQRVDTCVTRSGDPHNQAAYVHSA